MQEPTSKGKTESRPRHDFTPVLLGSDQNVYGMARSFHQAYGAVSLAIGKGRLPATSDSSIVKVVIAEPRLEEDEVFKKTLIGFAKENTSLGRLLLVPCGDNYVKLLSRNAEALSPYFEFNCPNTETVSALSEKESFYRVCDEYGLDHPKTEECTYDNYKTIKTPFDFPIVVKPSNSVAYWNCSFAGKKKVFVISSEREFRAVLDAIYSSSYKDTLILQEFIPGEDEMMRVVNCYCDRNGRVRLFALGRVLLEEHTAQGIGSYAAIIPGRDDALRDRISAFLEKIKYTGFINIDIKLDSRDGKYKFFEMNLRQGRSSFFVTAAGCNLAEFLVDDVIYNSPREPVTCEAGTCLWTIIPKRVILRFVHNEALKDEVRRLCAAKKTVRQLYYKPDMNFKRGKMFFLNQANYMRKYKKNFQKKGFSENK